MRWEVLVAVWGCGPALRGSCCVWRMPPGAVRDVLLAVWWMLTVAARNRLFAARRMPARVGRLVSAGLVMLGWVMLSWVMLSVDEPAGRAS